MNRISTATVSLQGPLLSRAGRNVAASSSPRVRGSNRGMRTPGARREPDVRVLRAAAAKLARAQYGVTGRRDAHEFAVF